MKEAIVDNHEWYETLDMLMEECAEMIRACNKFKRACGIGYPTETTCDEACDKASEEFDQAVADCLNALRAAMYDMNVDSDKIERLIEAADERMAANERNH